MAVFHRYNSTIHGNYRQAYLRCGLLIGALLSVYIVGRLLAGSMAESPISYLTDAILIVLVVLLTAYYRNSLPDKKITLKEAMLFGIGTSLIAAIFYTLAIWAIGLTSPAQTVLFTATLSGQTITPQDPQLNYWAALWAIVTFVDVALLGSFAAFLAAIFFRNEKSEIKYKQQ
ncbi:MAG: DUF4199 domain-containing protein [Bacteroidales bacterium]|nr:DUF4199 domain-containing protein [Bacteroidales bacterium]